MKAVGEMLREERKRQGMSIDDVMSRTKVSRRHIEALEDGSITDLPHPVYVKGFLKVYAELLGLEYQKLLPAVDDAYANLGLDPAETEPHARPSENISLSQPQRSGRLTRLIIFLLILSLLGAGGYYAYEYFFAEKSASSTPASDKQESVVPPDTPAVSESNAGVVEETITEVEEPITTEDTSGQEMSATAVNGGIGDYTPNNSPDSAQANVPEDSLDTPPGESQEQTGAIEDEAVVSELAEAVVQGAEKPAEATASEPVAAPASPNIVIIPETARQAPSSKIKVLQVIAKGQCWIEAKVDAELTTDFYVRKGERVDIKFQENLAVKFGNVGEVSLRYNGKPFTTAVPANGVKTLVFPPPGL